MARSQGHGTPLGSPCWCLRAQGAEGDLSSSFLPMDCRNIFYLSNHALAHYADTRTMPMSIVGTTSTSIMRVVDSA